MSHVPDTKIGGFDEAPVVSVIIPARNEELSIASCLESLVGQVVELAPTKTAGFNKVLATPAGLSYEIIVVDDGSTDRTAAIAESFKQVSLIAADPLQAGWTGKSNACATGARHGRGSWLLFTDADTVHKPNALERSLAEAKSHQASLLSYSPQQDVSDFVQCALMPLIFAELACTYRSKDVCDPASPVAAANGQFLLITREAYDAVGGHAAVAGNLLEDVALARLVKQSGRKLQFRYGGDIVRTRMYRTFTQMREGWTKNFALLFPMTEKLALKRSLEFIGSIGAAIAAALAWISGAHRAALVPATVSITTTFNIYRRVRKAHFGTLCTILSPLGLPLFSYLLLRSRIFHKKGRVAWKGREYTGSATVAGTTGSAERSEVARG
jgi:glycosyltransferase involved in cell wall biosynthesis